MIRRASRVAAIAIAGDVAHPVTLTADALKARFADPWPAAKGR